MDHFINIYTQQATEYHQLMVPEDVDQNLLPALEKISPVANKRVLDLGTGTGRLPLLFGHKTSQMVCLDLHWDMLKEHQAQKQQQNGLWGVMQGDMRLLPVTTGWADVVTAGWAMGHFTGWYPDNWQTPMHQVLQEMHRVVTPSGSIIIMETLTTGSLIPAPPTKALAQYYTWLENEWGFTRQEIRTDYQFASVDEAITKTEFFFGPDMAAMIKENGWDRLPEWTGVWGKRISSARR